MKKIFTFLVALMATFSLYAETYFLKNTWGEATASWKQMIDDEGSFILPDVVFDGKDIAINTTASDEGARTIKPENVQAMLGSGFEAAELAAGDGVMFVYDPESYSQYDETQSGLMAIINSKAGYAIKVGETWKNMAENEGSFAFGDVAFDGKDVQLAHGNEIFSVKPENIMALLNFEDAELSIGDEVLFVFDPEMRNQYDETQSGLTAIINSKAGYAIKVGSTWKNMAENEGSFAFGDVAFDGKDVQLAHGNEIFSVKPENIMALLNFEDAELSIGDEVLFVFDPEMRNQYDETQSGLIAMINSKAGYAIKVGEAWKNMAENEGSFAFGDVAFDGKDVQLAHGNEIFSVKPENIMVLLNFEDAELSIGDEVLFVFDPEMRNQYNEKESGLTAMINSKAGFAIKVGKAWKNMAENEGSFAFGDVAFDGKDVQLAHGNEIFSVKPENIMVLLNFEDAELSIGDEVLFVFDPEMRNQYDETQSGLIAMINSKAGYAIKVGEAWKNMAVDPEDEDWWTLEDVEFDGKDVQLAHGNEIRAIKPESITAFLDYDFAELSVGDRVIFVYRPSMYNSYNKDVESGMQAMISFKNGYALKSTWVEGEPASWKNMVKQDEDTYIIENVVFDGKDVALVEGNEIRTIKVENIKAYLLPEYEDAVLAAGDEIIFMYTPSEYNRYDETQSGLSALITKKIDTGIDIIKSNTENVKKVLIDGQLFIIRNGNTYNAAGILVK